MMAGLKSPTMKRQDRQTRNAIKRNPNPNETRPGTCYWPEPAKRQDPKEQGDGGEQHSQKHFTPPS
jgi:hypothetical protein